MSYHGTIWEQKTCTEVRNIEFISKQLCQFFVFTFLSLQLKISVHHCILIKFCCLIAFPPHPLAYFSIEVLLEVQPGEIPASQPLMRALVKLLGLKCHCRIYLWWSLPSMFLLVVSLLRLYSFSLSCLDWIKYWSSQSTKLGQWLILIPMKVTSSLLTIILNMIVKRLLGCTVNFTVQPKNNACAITYFCARRASFLAPFCCSLSQSTFYMCPCMITYCHRRVLIGWINSMPRMTLQ